MARSSRHSTSLVLLVLVAASALMSCGAPPPLTVAKRVEDTEPERPVEVRKAALECGDGTCFRCGEGLCLAGQYCSTETQTCSWLSECATKATCECVTRVLGACGCEERDGGAFVTCR